MIVRKGTNLQKRVFLSEVLEAKDLTSVLRAHFRRGLKIVVFDWVFKRWIIIARTVRFLRQTQDRLFALQTSLRMTACRDRSDFDGLIPKMWVNGKSPLPLWECDSPWMEARITTLLAGEMGTEACCGRQDFRWGMGPSAMRKRQRTAAVQDAAAPAEFRPF